MSRMKVAVRLMLLLSLVLTLGLAGCGGSKTGGGGGGGGGSRGGARRAAVTEEDKARLDDAKVAAEDAERKLTELRQERIRLEAEAAGGAAE